MVEPNPNQEPNQENTNNEEQNRITKGRRRVCHKWIF